MESSCKFEVMAIQKEEQNISSEIAMIYLLAANGRICHDIQDIDKEAFILTLKSETTISVQAVPNSLTPLNDQYYGVFHITVKGIYTKIEPLRIPFIKYLMQNRFTIFIVNDEVSQQMTKELYPLINRVETCLRTYLIKFFIKMYGTDFFEKIADQDMNKKLVQTEKNLSTLKKQLGIPSEKKLSTSLLKVSMYGIEFSQLGKIIYSDKMGGVASLDDAIKLIKSVTNLPQLQNDIFCFGDKYFKKSFIDKGFQQKWEELTRIRHIVAHNNICLNEDYEKGKALATNIIDVIEAASSELDRHSESVYEQNEKSAKFLDEDYKIITPEVFLDLLGKAEIYEKAHDGYVGLRLFVSKILYKENGYAIGPSYAVANNLDIAKKVEIYDQMEPEKDYSVKAIRTIV